MKYCISAQLDGVDFAEAVAMVEAALAAEGFGILCRIDVAETLKNKLGKTMLPYTILGACNPALADEAIRTEPRVGVMLPCNLLVRGLADGSWEVAAIDPLVAMGALDNAQLCVLAGRVRSKLDQVFMTLRSRSVTPVPKM